MKTKIRLILNNKSTVQCLKYFPYLLMSVLVLEKPFSNST